MRRQQLAATKRGVDPFARERIEEIGGVADERGPGSPGASRCRRKGPRRAHRRYSLRSHESLGEVRSRCDPLLEERGLVFSNPFRARLRNHYRHVHLAIADIHYSKVPVIIDVHLAHVRDALNVPIVGDKRDATRPDSAGFHQPQPASNHRAQSIGADDVSSSQRSRLAAGTDHGHAGDAVRAIARDVGDPHAFLNPRAGLARAAEHDLVEYRASDREALVAKPVKAMV